MTDEELIKEVDQIRYSCGSNQQIIDLVIRERCGRKEPEGEVRWVAVSNKGRAVSIHSNTRSEIEEWVGGDITGWTIVSFILPRPKSEGEKHADYLDTLAVFLEKEGYPGNAEQARNAANYLRLEKK